MCGIIGYIGKKKAAPILLRGLKRLAYRGYDSAGLALIEDANLVVCKRPGKVAELESLIEKRAMVSTVGIGHTRWATHGEPNEINAHPHLSESGEIALVHNGIIENYRTLKEELLKRGHHFVSQTDTEVLVHLIEDIQKNERVNLAEAVRRGLKEVVGAYAIAVMSSQEPDLVIAARKGSPLVIGIGEDEFYLASDPTPIVEHTQTVIYLKDEEIAVLPRRGVITIKTINGDEATPYLEALELKLERLEKAGFDHFMLKEIFEQPRSIRDSLRGRLQAVAGTITLGGVSDQMEKLIKARRIIFIGCGTSWHAGLVAEHLFENLARLPAEVEYASEFRYREPLIYPDDIVIAISQSGETADTLAAVELAKAKGATVLGICNVVGSSIARATAAGIYTHAGPEIGVASTKAFTAQVSVLTLVALELGRRRGLISREQFTEHLQMLDTLPEMVTIALSQSELVKAVARRYQSARNAIYLGRRYGFPVALEGALKLKEISYIHAEGYPAAEMKHGPIALIDQDMPVVVIATRGPSYEKILSNIEEVRSRRGQIIGVVTAGDKVAASLCDHVIEIPAVPDFLVPLLAVIPLQLLAYHLAVLLGRNVDQPRNLAKSVTVE